MSLNESELPGGAGAERPRARQFFAAIVIVSAVSQALGATLKMPTQLEVNDISRWCTVWSLVERGTYQIDECPWQIKTNDKVKLPDPFAKVEPGQEPPKHFYSSKPPLLPTLIAGAVYPFRKLTGVPLDHSVPQPRVPRNVPDPKSPRGYKVDTPAPVPWPVMIYYLKPAVVALNVVPFLAFLVLFARMLDRYALDDWAWMLSLAAAAYGTLLNPFLTTLNNHTVAAFSAFFALDGLLKILETPGAERRSSWFAQAGFWGAFCAANELPAAFFGLALFGMVLYADPRRTIRAFVPAAAIPSIGLMVTQYLALGTIKPAYTEFGGDAYNWDGAYWSTPLEMDWFSVHPESRPVYLFHMLLGHHGVFSLTPIFIYSMLAIGRTVGKRGATLRGVSFLTLCLTILMVLFYGFYAFYKNKTSNYGGSTQGLRWLFWLIPFWLILLPRGLERSGATRWSRRLSLAALAASVFSVGYAWRMPWSHPWVLDMLEHMNLYTLTR